MSSEAVLVRQSLVGFNGITGLCPGCLRKEQLTSHHYPPRMYFRRDRNRVWPNITNWEEKLGSKTTILICRYCHNQIEALTINRLKRIGEVCSDPPPQPRQFYQKILLDFLEITEEDLALLSRVRKNYYELAVMRIFYPKEISPIDNILISANAVA